MPNDRAPALPRTPSVRSVMVALVIVLTTMMVPAHPAHPAPAASGDLDPSFGSGGKVTTPMRLFDNVHDVAIQQDGRIVVAGFAVNGTHHDFTLARYRVDGTLDPSFGNGGTISTSIAASLDVARAVAIQDDGKIVAAGYTFNQQNLDFAVVRYNANGTTDRSFGTRGIVTTAIGTGSDFGEAVAIQEDGRIVVAGYTTSGGTYDFALARYRRNGTLDDSFGPGGTVTTPIGSGSDFARALAIQPNGRIVAAGDINEITGNRFALARYMANGSLDDSFGPGGTVTTPIGASAVAHDVVLQTDGKIVVAGEALIGSTYDFALARYGLNGVLDDTFGPGGGGTVTLPIGSGADRAFGVDLQDDGRIVAAGAAFKGTNHDLALARFRRNGTIDASFGSGGKVTTAFGSGDDQANAVAVQANGRIVAAGNTYTGDDTNFALARYTPGGSLDGSFGPAGKVVTPIGSVSSQANALAIQEDGKVVAAGQAFNGANNDFAVARYNRNGSLDQSFGSGGKVITPIGSSTDHAYGVVIQDDGKIVVAGITASATEFDFALARYNPDGSLDTTFDSDGRVTTDFDSSSDAAYAVAIQGGKILAAGRAYRGSASFDFAMARYDDNGALDGSFDTDGKVTTDFGSVDEAHGMAIQTDDKIVLAGHTYGAQRDFAVARYNADGTPDTDFGSGGKVSTDFNNSSSDFAQGVAIQANGKIVAAGSSSTFPDYPFGLARYLPDGQLDQTFGSGGKVTTLVGPEIDVAEAVAIQSNGRIVAAGRSHQDQSTRIGLVRYRQDGSLDASFGTGGRVRTLIGTSSTANGIAIRPDDRIVVAGYAGSGTTFNFALARYQA